MRLGFLERPVRASVAINSHKREVAVREEKNRPEVGIRWGRPSQFSFSNIKDEPTGMGWSVDSQSGKKSNKAHIIDAGGTVDDFVIVHTDGSDIGSTARRHNRISLKGSYPYYKADRDGVLRRNGSVSIDIKLALSLHTDSDEPLVDPSSGVPGLLQ